MPLNDPALQVQECLKNLHDLLHKLEGERVKNEPYVNNIAMAKRGDDESETHFQKRMKDMYLKAVNESHREEDYLRSALSKIYEIQAIRNERRIQARKGGSLEVIGRGTLMKMLVSSAQSLPLFVGKPGEKAPPLCGAMPPEKSYIAKEGDMVVALVKGTEEEVNWILAEVVCWNPLTKMYEVDDIDEEQKARHTLSKEIVVPLPLMRANPETDAHALFPKGAIVMALYPQTTCFYKAVVDQLPTSPTDEYRVLFEDSSYETGYSPAESVAQRYVIAADRDIEPA